MAFDPFPNTSDATTELRFASIFAALNTIIFTPTDPVDLKEGLAWVNTTTQTLKIYGGGITWTIGITPATS